MKQGYTTYYDEQKHIVQAVPSTHRVVPYLVMRIAYPLLCLGVSALVRIGFERLVDAWLPLSSDSFWGTAIVSVPSGLVLVFLFVFGSLRMGLYPLIFKDKLELDMSQKMDRSLAELLKKNQKKLSTDWFYDWSVGTITQKEKYLSQMRGVLYPPKEKADA